MKDGAIKRPKKTRGFSWGRAFNAKNGLSGWRMYRWDQLGRMHAIAVFAMDDEPRAIAASRLRAACHHLRDKVDEIDLSELGVT